MKEVYTSYRYKGDTEKLTYSITIRYIRNSSSVCGVCNSLFISIGCSKKKYVQVDLEITNIDTSIFSG